MLAAKESKNLMLIEVEGRPCFVPANETLGMLITDPTWAGLLSEKVISQLLRMPEKEMALFGSLLKLPIGSKITQELLIDLFFGSERSSILGLIERFKLTEDQELLEKTLSYLMKHSTNQVEFTSAMSHLNGLYSKRMLSQVLSESNKIRYLFRGSSVGFEGIGSLVAGRTPTSTDPVVSTIFALNSEYLSKGKGVLKIARIENLKKINVGYPNDLSNIEMEVALSIKPSELEAFVEIEVSAEKARMILKEIGVELPPSNFIKTINDVEYYIRNTRRLSNKEIEIFTKRIIEK